MRTYTMWNESNFKKVKEMVEKYQKNNKPIMHAFYEIANELKLDAFTIRNLYYKKLKEKGVYLGRNIKHYTKDEENKLFENIENLRKQGNSIRGACKKLANNNAVLFLRFQNKYRSIIKRKKCEEHIIPIKIKENQLLTDADITNLVYGVVRLIKKNATYEMDKKYKEMMLDYQTRLNQMIVEMKQKNLFILEILKDYGNTNCNDKFQNLLNEIKKNDPIHSIKEI